MNIQLVLEIPSTLELLEMRLTNSNQVLLNGLISVMRFNPGTSGKITDIKATRGYCGSLGILLGVAQGKKLVEEIHILKFGRDY